MAAMSDAALRTRLILDLITRERQRQIVKFGDHTNPRAIEHPDMSNERRLRCLMEEVGEVAEAIGDPEDGNGKGDLAGELVQVAAVVVAWLEALAREAQT